MFCLTGTENSLFVRYAKKFSMSTQIFFFKHAKLERVTKFGTRECGNANLGTRKKSFEKAGRNVEREEEMKERGHASQKGPAGTHAQFWLRIRRGESLHDVMDHRNGEVA